MADYTRRAFLNRAALLASASATLAALPPGFGRAEEPAPKRGSANDRLRIAVVGVRGRGMDHLGSAEKGKESGFLDPANNCEVVALCDADAGVIGPAMKRVKDAQGAEPKYVQDFRRLLDDKAIDAISVATPNHWHATMAVWAMRAGKDVYCEKPASHEVNEGRRMAEAMAETGRLCQVGTQSRSNPGLREAVRYLHDGKAGTVKLAYGLCYKPRKSIGKVSMPTAPPKTLDYDLWCGPAAVLPVARKQLHYDWHWTWEYGNGDFGNQGVHEADKARWGLKAGMPKAAVSVGGRFGYSDDGETPNTQLNLYEFDAAHLLFEVRGLYTKDYKGVKVGNVWFGDKGYVVCPSYSGGVAYDPDGAVVQKFSGGADRYHYRNFVAAVRDRKPEALNCPAEEGHLSAAVCHLGNISYRLGAPATLATAGAAFDAVPAAKEAFERMKSHAADNGVAASTPCVLGAALAIDPKSEKFTSAGTADVAKANALLTRTPRKGFDLAAGW